MDPRTATGTYLSSPLPWPLLPWPPFPRPFPDALLPEAPGAPPVPSAEFAAPWADVPVPVEPLGVTVVPVSFSEQQAAPLSLPPAAATP
ncbi:hypothetical protein ABZ646_12405 [Streptomyces sp. NPDC007162]|uniref:hypothetical protein n=1 Tax=Streptomyces sp. NPDC007162 TaxID=3156917 RepID=UPI0033CA05AD